MMSFVYDLIRFGRENGYKDVDLAQSEYEMWRGDCIQAQDELNQARQVWTEYLSGGHDKDPKKLTAEDKVFILVDLKGVRWLAVAETEQQARLLVSEMEEVECRGEELQVVNAILTEKGESKVMMNLEKLFPKLINLAPEAATQLLTEAQITLFRIIGPETMVTMEFEPERLNLRVEDNKVVECYLG